MPGRAYLYKAPVSREAVVFIRLAGRPTAFLLDEETYLTTRDLDPNEKAKLEGIIQGVKMFPAFVSSRQLEES